MDSFHLTASFNHFAGAGLVLARNQCVSIDKSDALAILSFSPASPSLLSRASSAS